MPHLLYFAWGFPPAAKSCAHRLLATANTFAGQGWDVTAVTLTDGAWYREHGIDSSTLPLVHPSIRMVKLPLYREDREVDIRSYGRLRAQRPEVWRRWHRRLDRMQFPEPVFGRWRRRLEQAADALWAERPADLVLATAPPYVFLSPALHLHRRHGVPYVLDYRDSWSLNILADREAFPRHSRRGRIEQELIGRAHAAWFVNSPIMQWYSHRYPEAAERFRVVRNGSDIVPGQPFLPLHEPDPTAGLTFGYLGTLFLSRVALKAVLEGWQAARAHDELLSRSRLVFRGHTGAGSARGASPHARLIARSAAYGVSYDGPVAKARTKDVYAGWDALLFLHCGGRYVTSGKVYEYVATGLPIMSAHEPEHAATEVLADYPLWVPNRDMSAEALRDAFTETARMVVSATPAQRAGVRAYANRYERYSQLEPAVRDLTRLFAKSEVAA